MQMDVLKIPNYILKPTYGHKSKVGLEY